MFNFYLFSNFKDKNYEISCLIIGILINCCERNKLFRNSFNDNKINGICAIEFLLHYFNDLTLSIKDIEDKTNIENNNDNDNKYYMECKIISYYLSLLIGFLLQNTTNFKFIATKLNDLDSILLCLTQFLQFQNKLKQSKNKDSNDNNDSFHTLTIIMKIIEIVEIRNGALKALKSR